MTAIDTIRPAARVFTSVASIHSYGQSPSIGRSRNAVTRSSISAQSRLTWLPRVRLRLPEGMLGDAAHAERLDQIVHRARGDALDVGFLDDGRKRLLGHASRLQEAGKARALPELRNAQLDRAGARLPIALTVAIALGQTLGALLAQSGTSQAADLPFHQALRGKADHLAQQVGIRGLLQQTLQAHHLVGHRWGFRFGVVLATRPYRRNRRWPPLRRPPATALQRESAGGRLRYPGATPRSGT
jgi:hypothetical protein